MKKTAKKSFVGAVLIVLIFGTVFFSVFLCDKIACPSYIPAVNMMEAGRLDAVSPHSTGQLSSVTGLSSEGGSVAYNSVYDLNSVTAEQLMSIDGIGPAIAERIIAYRNEHGRFNSVDELLNVNGIGEAKLEACKDCLYVENPAVSGYYGVSAVTSAPEIPSEIFTQTVPSVQEETTVPKVIYLSDEYRETHFQSGTTKFDVSFPIELNSATKEQLVCIDGVGDALAQRIVDYADENGFSSVDDLTNVSGIGEVKLETIRPYVYVDTKGLTNKTTKAGSSTSLTETAQTTEYTPDVPIELNNATIEELTWLPGIGETTAIKIIFYAQQYGFYSVDDLLNIPGIGEAKLDKIRPYVYVDTSGLPQKTTTTASVTTTAVTTTEYKPKLPIELNSATIEELTWLPGIGETTAIKIVVYAQQYGFYSVDDLLNVSGIGKDKLDKIRPYVYVDTSGLPAKTTTAATTSETEEETTVTTATPHKVNLNTCTKADLLVIDGISEELADSIIFYRTEVCEFVCLEQLYDLGISDALYNKITPYLCW